MNFSELRIGNKLRLAFAGVIAIYLAMSATSFWSNARLAQAERLNQRTYDVVLAGNDLLASMLNIEVGARGYLLSGSEDFLKPWNDGLRTFAAAHEQALQLTADNPAQQQRLEQMAQCQEELRRVEEAMIAARRQVAAGQLGFDAFAADFALGKDKTVMRAFRALASEFDAAERVKLAALTQEAATLRSLSNAVQLFGTLLAVALAAGLAWWVSRAITAPLQRAVGVAQHIAKGELNTDIGQASQDETGDLLRALGAMQASLTQVVNGVRENAEGVAAASTQIAEGNNDLSSRTEAQASALQQTTASMEKLSTAVKQNADSAQQASEFALGASGVAVHGGEVVSQVVETMKAINDSSTKIAAIIAVVDDIAFRTNILALNAAVEAARAGNEGRGFAVVASEVRSLAGRSAGAAREIKSLISASVERVGHGAALVDQAGVTMKEVVTAIQRVTDIVAEISTASSEQSAGVAQVSGAVSQMDQATQQNAALVEESAAAAEILKRQAQRLVESVAVFRLA